jgi:hypothetical protein
VSSTLCALCRHVSIYNHETFLKCQEIFVLKLESRFNCGSLAGALCNTRFTHPRAHCGQKLYVVKRLNPSDMCRATDGPPMRSVTFYSEELQRHAQIFKKMIDTITTSNFYLKLKKTTKMTWLHKFFGLFFNRPTSEQFGPKADFDPLYFPCAQPFAYNFAWGLEIFARPCEQQFSHFTYLKKK